MATKMENRVGVNFAFFRSNPWRQSIVLLEICCKDTYIHESVKNKISDFWLNKAQNIRACHNYFIIYTYFVFFIIVCYVCYITLIMKHNRT